MDRVKLYWMQSLNFGDKLTPWMIQKMTGEFPMYVDKDFHEEYVIGAGSILNHAGENAVVWGAGLGSMSDKVSPDAEIVALRGPLSGFRSVMCGNTDPGVYGDPGMLLPKYIPASPNKTSKIAIVPHYVDQYRAEYFYGGKDDFVVVNILGNIEKVVEEITSCVAVVSTSLHGLVVADAYGIPNAWAVFDNRLYGDGMKFLDHKLSGGDAKSFKPEDVRDGVYRNCSWWKNVARDPISIDTDRLMEVCPWL